MTNKDLVRKLRKGPDLDQYLEGKGKDTPLTVSVRECIR